MSKTGLGLRCLCALSLFLLLTAGTATASGFDREKYEQDLLDRGLSAAGLEIDAQPQGKFIERIEIQRNPIIEATDPWPGFLNIFHITTKEHIVRQELLFQKGDRYQEETVRESARNLRSLPLLFSVVRIIAARGSAPDRVVVLIITKDLWSLRVNSLFSIGGGVFNYLSIKPTEQNFLGLNQQVSLYTFINRDTYSIGEIYQVPRLFGTRLALVESLHLRINHQKGTQEGGFGSLSFGQPLYELRSRWAFSLGASFDVGVHREYEGVNIRQIPITWGTEKLSRDKIWDYRSFSAQAQLVRSFGQRYKTNVLAGYFLRSRTYTLPSAFPADPEPVRLAFRQYVLPRADQAGELGLQISFFEARYQRFQNIQTFGLTEDYRFGPQASFTVNWASPAFGFSQDAIRYSVSLGYQWLLGKENIFSARASASARHWPDSGLAEADDAHTDWVDRRAELRLENVSPPLFGLGRLFVRFAYVYTQFSVNRALLGLGGDNTLRGFVSGFRAGERLLNLNLEFRSQPWVFRTLHLGYVLFYDGGDAYGFTADTDFVYHQSLGIGLRGLFPQFDRGTIRLDIGIPLGQDFHAQVIEWITLSYLQAF